jgi:CheY-like chemotaxis protein
MSSAPSPPLPPSLPSGRSELVLVVDDDPLFLEVTRLALEQFGYRVIVAKDGARGMGLFAMQQGEVAAVITDLVMPVMDGSAFITALRHIDSGVPIVAVSGVTRHSDRALTAGAQCFVIKDSRPEALLEGLATVLGCRPGSAAM